MEYRQGIKVCFPLMGERHLAKLTVKAPTGQ
jgi:hypothetical protein